MSTSFIARWSEGLTSTDLELKTLIAPTMPQLLDELKAGYISGAIKPAGDQISLGRKGLIEVTEEQFMGGHKNKHPESAPVENVQTGPPPPGIPTTQSTLPPQPADLQEAHKLCGHPVRAVVGGRVMTVVLVDYDQGSGTYNGIAQTVVALDVDAVGVQLRPVYGLRPYPYTERPNYAFQWVECGADESPIINIAQHNAVA